MCRTIDGPGAVMARILKERFPMADGWDYVGAANEGYNPGERRTLTKKEMKRVRKFNRSKCTGCASGLGYSGIETDRDS
jgi:hypothetical protein